MLEKRQLDEASQELLSIAIYMETHGKCSGIKLNKNTGAVCIMGGYAMIKYGSTKHEGSILDQEAMVRLADAIPITKFDRIDPKNKIFWKIADFNDHSSLPEVVTKLREVAHDPKYFLEKG